MEWQFEKVDRYLKLAAEEPQRWLVVDAAQSKEKVAEVIWRRIAELVPEVKV